jgi:hypothetical protein
MPGTGLARNALLAEEIALRKQIEAVAAQRRALPPGVEVPEDYVFERRAPMCRHLLDSVNGGARPASSIRRRCQYAVGLLDMTPEGSGASC